MATRKQLSTNETYERESEWVTTPHRERLHCLGRYNCFDARISHQSEILDQLEK